MNGEIVVISREQTIVVEVTSGAVSVVSHFTYIRIR